MSCDGLSLIIQILTEELPLVSESKMKTVKQQIRKYLGGRQIYIKKNEENLRETVRQQFNGKNRKLLAKQVGVTERTIRRWTSNKINS